MQFGALRLSQYDEVPLLPFACPSEATIAAYIEHTLSVEKASGLESHMASCDRCRLLLVIVDRSTQEVPEIEPPQPKK
jgi:hypothetical protein